MRLICPNCGAQYEVAEDVIPTDGRDVECSNCGHTWFEQPSASLAAVLGAATAPLPEPVSEADLVASPLPDLEPNQKAPTQREISSEVTDILRQEAAYEKSAREADTNTIETQPDQGLSHAPNEDRRSINAHDSLAHLRGKAENSATPRANVETVMEQKSSASRRKLLPDIEEINSTLLSNSNVNTTVNENTDKALSRSRFKRGFVYATITSLTALAIYVFTPQISLAVPQIEPYLTSYVEWVDELRIWLDRHLQALIESAQSETTIDPN
ncbi:MAG: putative Zn finger-like uncharacterized protein [Alteromonas macleodii]|jgi:predicted Zn finger-like uncharacterized protein